MFRRLLVLAPVVGALLLAPSGASAATLTACPGGGGAFTTIQAAIDAAAPGDTINACAQTFNESQVMVNKPAPCRARASASRSSTAAPRRSARRAWSASTRRPAT